MLQLLTGRRPQVNDTRIPRQHNERGCYMTEVCQVDGTKRTHRPTSGRRGDDGNNIELEKNRSSDGARTSRACERMQKPPGRLVPATALEKQFMEQEKGRRVRCRAVSPQCINKDATTTTNSEASGDASYDHQQVRIGNLNPVWKIYHEQQVSGQRSTQNKTCW